MQAIQGWRPRKCVIDVEELTNQIYDTLVGNVGFSIYHVAFDSSTISESETDARLGLIRLQIEDEVFEMHIQRINPDYFNGYEKPAGYYAHGG